MEMRLLLLVQELSKLDSAYMNDNDNIQRSFTIGDINSHELRIMMRRCRVNNNFPTVVNLHKLLELTKKRSKKLEGIEWMPIAGFDIRYYSLEKFQTLKRYLNIMEGYLHEKLNS